MKRYQLSIVRLDHDVTIGDDQVFRSRRIERPETPSRAAWLFLLQVRHGVAWRQLFKKGFEDLGLVVDREVDVLQSVGQKLIADDFDHRPVTHGNKWLGKNTGERC